jgi:S-DNA-T family DNA segregation ATPase FtsK/SpoIIIE
MCLTLTVVNTSTGAVADLRVTASEGSPAAPVVDAIRRTVGADPHAPVSIDGTPVLTTGAMTDAGLVDGVTLTIGPPVSLPEPATIDLVVASGPAAGQRIALPEGRHVIGRGATCDVTIADHSISRIHLAMTVRPGATTITDLDSANGTRVDGLPLAPHACIELASRSTLRLGDSEIRLAAPTATRVPMPLPDGSVVIHRAPRLVVPPPKVEVTFPAMPSPPLPVRIPILAAITPLIAGVALSLLLRQWQFLAFTALSPVMILGQAASDRRSSRRAVRDATREHARATEAAEDRLRQAVDAERVRRHDGAPDIAQLSAAAADRDRLLWQRGAADPDTLTLRLGRGELPGNISVVGGPGSCVVTDVPVCVSLLDTPVLGVCGPAELTTGLLRSLVVQAATLHGPDDLRVIVLAPNRAQEWGWSRWLPHLQPRGEPCLALFGFDDDQIRRRVGEANEANPTSRGHQTRTLVIVDGSDGRLAPTSAAALLSRRSATTAVIWSAGAERDLPSEAQSVVRLSTSPEAELRLARTGHGDDLVAIPDLVPASVAVATARALAPLRAAGTGAVGLPGAVAWAELHTLDLNDPPHAVQSLTKQWALGPSTETTLGQGLDGALTVDLCRDGPHALIAGTTGSGKSELLLSLVAGLVTHNRPDQLSLLLVDHKGGAAFARCAELPHTIGVVTDLDAVTTRRALLSLTAELRRREELLAAAGVADLEAYHRARHDDRSGTDELARLVIIVDEFAGLAEEQPDFIGGLVGIAQRGRSLGVHLVLATQRPDGVVSADIRANTRLRICLGVARENESRDVIDCPDAASISRTTPGRGYLRVGPGDLQAFQTARISGGRTVAAEAVVELSPVATLGDEPQAPITDTAADSELDLLIQAAVNAAATLRWTAPPPPWLPPLPEHLSVASLPISSPPSAVAWGLVDLPTIGQQPPLLLDLSTGGTTLIAGTARSGRTTAAMTVAVSAAALVSPRQLNLWAIDASAGLAELANLPHCGAVVPSHDAERVERLLGHLSAEVSRRRSDPDGDRSTLMLLIDSWEGLTAASELHDGARMADTVMRLASEGQSAGLHLVISCDRAGLVGRLSATASDKLVLRLAEPADFALIGLSGRDLPRELPPGRGIRAADLALVQIAERDAATTTAARAWAPPPVAIPSFAPLPRRVLLADVPRPAERAGQVVLGLSADDLSTLTMSRGAIGTSFVIAGPPGSGRTTALRLLSRQLTGRRIAVSCGGRSPLAAQSGVIRLPRDDQDHAVDMLDSLSGDPDALPDVLIDDADLLAEGPLWVRLEDLIRGGGDRDQVIVLAGTPDAVGVAFRGPLAQARRAKLGLLLCPASAHDGEIFGIRLPRRDRRDEPPGRGWLTRGGKAIRLQVADPGGDQPSTEFELSELGARSLE